MKQEVLKALGETKIVAIIRGMEPSVCVKLAGSYLSGGLRLVEVTFNQVGDPVDTTNAVRAIKAACPGMHVGVGTVLTSEQLEMAIDAGAEFMVTPSVNPALIRKASAAGLVTMPGAFTPTEIVTAHEAGADVVKVFPIRALGPQYVKDVLAPLRHVKLMAVGGVTPDNAADYIKAGCIGVGASGALVNKDWISADAWGRITSEARRFIEQMKGVSI